VRHLLWRGSFRGARYTGSGEFTRSYKVITKHVTLPPFQIERINVVCPAGMVPMGGGGHLGIGSWPRASAENGYVSESSIDLAGNGWETTVINAYSIGPLSFTVSAVCATR
jgi:hypothetical protein